jgi:hypothetical protein
MVITVQENPILLVKRQKTKLEIKIFQNNNKIRDISVNGDQIKSLGIMEKPMYQQCKPTSLDILLEIKFRPNRCTFLSICERCNKPVTRTLHLKLPEKNKEQKNFK